MRDEKYHGDDLISKPPVGAVLLQKIGSWDILFSHAEQSIYIVPSDYHPEPFRISLKELEALQAVLAPKLSPQHAPQSKPQPTPQTGTAPKQKPAKKKKRRHSKRKKRGR